MEQVIKKYVVAFDVDGTLRCNCTETCQDPNTDIVDLVRILAKFKNIDVVVWSGGGADYAERFGRLFKIDQYVKGYYGKNLMFTAKTMPPKHIFAPDITPDIAIDDIQDCELGLINLIVREK